MSRQLDWVYKSNGLELSTPTFPSLGLSTAVQLVDDGTYIWVANGTEGISIYQYFGSTTDDEPAWNLLDSTNIERYGSNTLNAKLRLVTIIKITGTQILRTTCIPALSAFPALAPTDADGTYNISGQTVVVKTQSSGERAITTVTARTGNVLNSYFLVKDSTNIYVSNGTTFSEVMVFNIASQSLSSSIMMSTINALGVYPTMSSNLCLADNKLWAVASYYDDTTPQKLVSYNLSSSALVNTSIPVRSAIQKSWIADGYNGSVYVSHFNGWGVSRFTYANVFGATMRVNGYPTGIFTTPAGAIWVSSFGGMLSSINGSTDAVNNGWGTESKMLSFNIDPADSSFVWYTNSGGSIVKKNLNTMAQIELKTGTEDWVYSSDRFVTYVNSLAFSALKNSSYTIAQGKIWSKTYFDGVNTYHPDFIITDSAGVVTLIEYIDYKINDITGIVTFLPTSTVVTSLTVAKSLKVSYYYPSFYPFFSTITAQKTYSSGGTITVLPYLFTISQNMLFALRLDPNISHLQLSTGVTGQGAIVAGSNQYFGD